MKKIILIALAATAIVVAFHATAVFYEGTESFILPLILILGLTAVLGIIVIPIFIFRMVKHKPVSNALPWVTGLAIGTYFGFLIAQPLLNWDSDQRDLSGQIIATELERYRTDNLEYPAELTELGTSHLNSKLPSRYQLERFNYDRTTSQFDLDIPVPLTNRYHWNIETGKWEYQ